MIYGNVAHTRAIIARTDPDIIGGNSIRIGRRVRSSAQRSLERTERARSRWFFFSEVKKRMEGSGTRVPNARKSRCEKIKVNFQLISV